MYYAGGAGGGVFKSSDGGASWAPTRSARVAVGVLGHVFRDGAMQRNDALAQLSGVDTMLNRIDAELKHATAARAQALRAFRARLTYDPQNVEDLTGEAQIRERILDQLARIGSSSLQMPNAPERAEMAKIKARLRRDRRRRTTVVGVAYEHRTGYAAAS